MTVLVFQMLGMMPMTKDFIYKMVVHLEHVKMCKSSLPFCKIPC